MENDEDIRAAEVLVQSVPRPLHFRVGVAAEVVVAMVRNRPPRGQITSLRLHRNNEKINCLNVRISKNKKYLNVGILKKGYPCDL
jgi:hypothetical protein